jgi:hypothetical protein
MRIFVLTPNTFTGDELVPGEEYEVKPCEDGTNKQNSAFHALVQEYWVSGCHSYNAYSFEHFRELIKLYLGAGAESYYSLVDDTGKKLEKPIVRHRVKSWARYSKKERKESIDRLIAEMQQTGVNSYKFEEILKGMVK